MSSVVLNVVIVLALIVIEGLFVAAEIALVSLREGQARAMTGRRGAAVARLTSDPNRFLATVQIGVTLTALLSSAFRAGRADRVHRRDSADLVRDARRR